MGWLHSVLLLSVFLGCSLVAAQYEEHNSAGQWVTTTKPSHPDEESSNGNSCRKRYNCRESNQQHDCVFEDVSIDRDTSYVCYGHYNHSLNDQKKITFKNSTMRKLPVTFLDSFRQIEELDLSNLQMEEIEPDALTNGINIEKLDMSFNVIRDLPQAAFGNMRSLRQLVLDRNELSNLPDAIFSGKPNLTSLSIANNKLERIEDNTFKSVTSLESLILSSNKLTSIDLAIFPNLFFGNVSFNLLTKLTIPVAVEILDASHNRINTVTGQRNYNLTKLYLAHNNLTDTAWLQQFFQLEVLDLSYNELEEITAKHFKHMNYLKELYLSNNRLVKYTQGSSPIRSLKILDVRHNHLLYVEKNQKQFDTLEQLYLDNNLIVTLKLSSTNKLQNLTLSKNDWDCKNLGELLPNVNKSVIGDSDRSCKQEYQFVNDLCCKVSDKPYLDRLIKQISGASLAEKFQRASGRCSVDDTIKRVQNFENLVITQNKRLQTTPQRDAEINQLQVDIQKLTQRSNQFKHAVTSLDVEVENNLRRYRVIKEPLVPSKENLRKVYAHLNNRREFKKQETKNRESDALLKKEEREAAERKNINFKDEVNKLKTNLKQIKQNIKTQETVVKRLEKTVNRNPDTRRITK